MAIKVRHDGNAAATAAAGLGSGRAKRRIETAKLAQNTPQHIQTLTPAHSSAPGAGGGSAPLTHAPSGASGASAPLTHAPTPTGGGGAGSRSGLLGGAGGLGGDDYKVTGTSIFDRPDDDSVWDPGNGGRWIRKWLPGEKEAEAAQRMNPVLAERTDMKTAAERELAEQQSLLATERDVAKAKLNAPAMPESPLMAAIRSLFPSAPALPAPAATAEPQQKGTVSIRPAVDGKVSMYDRVKDLFLGSGDASPVDGLKGLIDDADSVLLDVLAKAKAGFGLPSNNPVGNGSDTLRMLENLGGGIEAPVQQPDDIASVYAGGGSVFGQGSVTGGPLDYLRTPADGGDAGLESDEYASSMGGMIGALLRV